MAIFIHTLAFRVGWSEVGLEQILNVSLWNSYTRIYHFDAEVNLITALLDLSV